MSDFETTWTKDEFKAYLLLYCANADLIESEEERIHIKAAVGVEMFENIHKEFDNDNDYQSIQKITKAAKKLDYSQDQLDALKSEIKVLFSVDGNFDYVEKYMSKILENILNK